MLIGKGLISFLLVIWNAAIDCRWNCSQGLHALHVISRSKLASGPQQILPASFQLYAHIPYPKSGSYPPKSEVHLSAEQIILSSGRSSKSQMRVYDDRLYLAAALHLAGKPGAWQYDSARLCSWEAFSNCLAYKVQLMLPLSRGELAQTDAGLSWEITTHDTASQPRPEPDSIHAFSYLHSWEAGGINPFQNVLLVVFFQKQIRFTFFFFLWSVFWITLRVVGTHYRLLC